MAMDQQDVCNHTKIRLIAAAVGHQQCTKTDGTEVRITGTDKRILIGNDAYLAKVAAPAVSPAPAPDPATVVPDDDLSYLLEYIPVGAVRDEARRKLAALMCQPDGAIRQPEAADGRIVVPADGGTSTFTSEYEGALENDLAALRDLFPMPDCGELHDLWSEACCEPRAVLAYVKAQIEAAVAPSDATGKADAASAGGLTDAAILKAAEDSGISFVTDERRPDNATIIDFAQSILSLQHTPVGGKADQGAAVAAIAYALDREHCFDDRDAVRFLTYWNEGEFDKLRNNWCDVPDAVFIGADPMHPATSAADAKDAQRYRVLRQNVWPGDVSIIMTCSPPAGQSLAERIDMLCDLFIERNRAAIAAAQQAQSSTKGGDAVGGATE